MQAGSMQLPLPLAPAPIPAAGTAARSVRASYEAAAHTRRTLNWRPPTVGPNSSVLPYLSTLRDRSRQAVRNNGFAKGVISKLVTNIVGTGIKPLSKADDKSFRKAIQALWLLWCDEADADGQLDFYGLQWQAVWCWLEAGEVFLRERPRLPTDGLAVPLQVQVLEPELCPLTHNTTLPNGNKVRAGIEFDRIGRRVAYYFHPTRPGDLMDWDAGDLRRVPAQFVRHVYDPIRPGQLRGTPHLTQALIKLYELDKFDDATLLRQQIANLFAGFIERPNTDGSEVSVLTGSTPDDTQGGRPVVALEPGIMQELGLGEKINFSDPPDPPATYPNFMKQQLMSIAAATDTPYEVLTGDMAGLNDRVMRVILHEFRRGITARQHHIVAFQLCRPIWSAWLDRVYLSDALARFGSEVPTEFLFNRDPWARVKWMPQGWPYIHPVQDVQSSKDAIRSGFTSRAAVVSAQGEDVEVIDEEQAADNERADELGLTYESDSRGGSAPASPFQKPAPAPASTDDEDDEEEEEDDVDEAEDEDDDAPPQQRRQEKRS